MIPFFGLGREYEKNKNSYTKIIQKVLSHGKVLQGEEVQFFENEVAERSQRKYAIAVNSCTDSLFFSLKASGVKRGDEVLVTDFSFIASASCIKRLSAVPVFVDIKSDYHMDLSKAQKLISEKTKAIICVHLFGDMICPDEIEKFAYDNKLILIEDAAQSFGASYGDRKAGSIGLMSCFSFDPTKTIGSPGSGGMILTDDFETYQTVKQLRYHGRDHNNIFSIIGYNSQMSSLVAAILTCKLQYSEEWFFKRTKIANFYLENIDRNKYGLPKLKKLITHSFHKFVIQSEKRDFVIKRLEANDIQSLIHYPTPLHSHKCFQPRASFYQNDTVDCLTKKVFSLPIHPYLTDLEIEKIVRVLNQF